MFARVVTWEGGEEDAMRASAADIKAQSDAAGGPPPGVPAVGMTMLFDGASGRSMGIVLFETEEQMREGDATLNTMSPSNEGFGKRVSVDFYEVGVDLRL